MNQFLSLSTFWKYWIEGFLERLFLSRPEDRWKSFLKVNIYIMIFRQVWFAIGTLLPRIFVMVMTIKLKFVKLTSLVSGVD